MSMSVKMPEEPKEALPRKRKSKYELASTVGWVVLLMTESLIGSVAERLVDHFIG